MIATGTPASDDDRSHLVRFLAVCGGSDVLILTGQRWGVQAPSTAVFLGKIALTPFYNTSRAGFDRGSG